MIELQYPQKSPEWFTARRGMLTGSRVADVFAKTAKGPAAARHNLILELALERITGDFEPVYETQAMRIGVEREPLARGAYERHSGMLMRECGLIIHDDLCAASSPDGLTVEGNGGLEIKCPGAKAHLDCIQSGAIPAQYLPQCLHHMWIAELDWCDFVSFHPNFPDALQLFVTRIVRDDVREQLNAHADACKSFLIEVDEMVDKIQRLAA
jgi:putative phage-type endonuclease